MKKALSFILTLVMLLTVLPIIGTSVSAATSTVIEAESMTLISGNGQVQNMDQIFPGSGFSGGKQFWFQSTAVGNTLELSFALTESFSGQVTMAHCMAGDFGIFDVYIDGNLLYEDLDMYYNAGIAGQAVKRADGISLGNMELAAGTHTLKLICKGKNASNTYSDRYYGSVDCITLTSGYDYYDYDTPVTFEGEDMTVSALPNYEIQNLAIMSGGKQVLHKIWGAKSSIELSFTTSENYDGEIYAAFCIAKDFGIYDVYLDGVKKITFDAYNPGVSRSVQLIDTEGLPAGEHTVELVHTGSKNASSVGNLIGIDCILLGKDNPTVICEAENMTVEMNSVHPDSTVQGMESFNAGFSGSQMRYNSNRGAGIFELTFKTQKAYEGNAYLYLCKAGDFGIYDIYLDGTLLVDNYDCYSAQLMRAEVKLENVSLLPGEHTLKFVGNNRNAASTNNLLGIDCLVLGDFTEYTYSYADVVNLLTDLKSLALLPTDGEVGAASTSYDRKSYYDEANDAYMNWGNRVDSPEHGYGWTSNDDGNGYIEAIDGDPVKGIVALDVKGSGAVVRSFFATVGKGHIEIYVDGRLVTDMPLEEYVMPDGRYEGLDNLVYQTSARGYNNFVPITFNESCKIILRGGREKEVESGYWGRYYAFGYRLFEEEATVEPIRGDFTAKQREALLEANDILGNCGITSLTADKTATVTAEAGKTVTLLEIPGEGAISHLKVKINGRLSDAERAEAMQKLEMSIYWDGEASPSVWAPVGDLFGSSFGGEYTAYPMGLVDYTTFYSNWYMPYADGAKLVIENLTETDYSITVEAVTEEIDGNIKDYGRFHAKWSLNRFLPEREDRIADYTVLKTEGAGRFLGFNLHIYNIVGAYWWGEGDEKFFVDGEKFPSTYGTGSEDYFGYAWCSANYFSEAFHSQNVTPGKIGDAGNYNNVRFQIIDSIPFTESFEGAMEKYHTDDITQYTATAYWYLDAEGTDPYTPVKYESEEELELRYKSLNYELDKLNIPVTTNIIEGEEMTVISFEGGTGYTANGYAVQDMSSFPASTFSGGKQMYSGATVKSDSEMTLRFNVTEDFDGILRGAFCKAPNYAIIQLYLDDVKLGEPIDLCDPQVINSGLLELGEVSLDAGVHDLKIDVVGKSGTGYAYGIDCIVLGEHILTLVPAVEPTETAPGNIEYWECADCDTLYADIYGTTALTASPELPPVGSEASDVVLGVTAPETAIAGESFTVTVTATANEAAKLNALNFALDFDSDKLELVSLKGATELGGEYAVNGAAFGWYSAEGVDVTSAGTVIATATFNVKDTVTSGDTAIITLGDNANTKLTAKLYGEHEAFVPDVNSSDDITLYLESFEFFFITANEYKAIASDTKILAIKAEANSTTYSFGDYNFYWSSKYGAYLAIVGADITEENVKTLVTSTKAADTDVIAYNGDVSGDKMVTAGDAALVSEMLHAPASGIFTDLMRFEADVYGAYTEGGAYVTVSDATYILYKSVGLEYNG